MSSLIKRRSILEITKESFDTGMMLGLLVGSVIGFVFGFWMFIIVLNTPIDM